MSKYFFIALMLFSIQAFGEVVKDQFIKEEVMNREQIKMIKQSMQEAPTSSPVGGSRSGDLGADKDHDDVEKQKVLYEADDKSRRGL